MIGLFSGLSNLMTSDEVIKFIKNTALIALVVTGLTILTNSFVIQELENYLTVFFTLVREFVAPYDFFLDTNTMFKLFSYVLTFQIGHWIFKAYVAITHLYSEQ